MDHMGKYLAKWLPLYRNEQVSTNSNYIIRKVGTNYTQCLHRIRLRPITIQYSVEDLPQINPNNFTPDPITRHCSEPALFDQTLPDLLTEKTFPPTDEIQDSPSVLFYYTPGRVVRPAVPVAPPAEPNPLLAPELPQAPPPDIIDPLPINEDLTLDDVVLDTHSSDRPHELSDDNSDAFVVTDATFPRSEPSSSAFVRSRTHSRIYSSENSSSSISNFSGFDR